MSPPPRVSPWWALASLVPATILAALAAPWPWLPAALGRLHPLILHFPIALIFVVGLLETISVLAPRHGVYRVRLLLFLAATSAVTACACGYLLMETDGVEGALADRHLRGGVAVAALTCLALALRLARGFEARSGLRRGYRVVLAAACGVLVLASHDGASLTHGEDYLTENLPWLKTETAAPSLAFPTDTPVAEWDAYAHVVAPILTNRCSSCHSTQQAKGKLALDTWDALTRGGATGPLWVAGRPEDSLMVQRLELPLSHKERMPPKRKAQPETGEIALLRAWIKAGAPRTGTLATLGLDPDLLRAAETLPRLLGAPAAVVEDEATRVEKAYARRKTHAPALAAAQARWPGVIDYEARDSADLRVNAALLGSAFGDADLAALEPLREHIVWLDLSGTTISDASAPRLASFTRLRLLRLNETRITDTTVQALAPLHQLESLSLFRTRITDASAATLAALPRIKSLSTAETALSAPTPPVPGRP